MTGNASNFSDLTVHKRCIIYYYRVIIQLVGISLTARLWNTFGRKQRMTGLKNKRCSRFTNFSPCCYMLVVEQSSVKYRKEANYYVETLLSGIRLGMVIDYKVRETT